MARQFHEGLLQLNGTVTYFRKLIFLMLKIWHSLASTVKMLQAG
jgi:hypothetical protein